MRATLGHAHKILQLSECVQVLTECRNGCKSKCLKQQLHRSDCGSSAAKNSGVFSYPFNPNASRDVYMYLLCSTAASGRYQQHVHRVKPPIHRNPLGTHPIVASEPRAPYTRPCCPIPGDTICLNRATISIPALGYPWTCQPAVRHHSTSPTLQREYHRAEAPEICTYVS